MFGSAEFSDSRGMRFYCSVTLISPLQKFYRGVGVWVEGTPSGSVDWGLPGDINVTPGSVTEQTIEDKYSRQPAGQFGTFGRKRGTKALAQLKAAVSSTGALTASPSR